MPVNRVLLCISFLVFFTVLPTGEINAQEQILDDFETPRDWKIIVSDGAKTLNPMTLNTNILPKALKSLVVLSRWSGTSGRATSC